MVPDLDIKRDVPIVLNNIQYEDTYDGGYTTRRAVIYTMNFTAKTYLFGPDATNKTIKTLNKKFRNKDKHTDVLSFPFNKKQKKLKENYLGDIIISFNYMNKPKNLDNYQFKIKTIKIFIHGFLHLLGHDHQKNKEYKQMLNEEKKIFRSIEKTSILN